MDNQTLHSLGNNPEFIHNLFYVIKNIDGTIKEYSLFDIRQMMIPSLQGFATDEVSLDKIFEHAQKSFFTGMTMKELEEILILSAVQFIEHDTAYSFVACRLLLRQMYHEVVGYWPETLQNADYQQAFIKGIQLGVRVEKFDNRLLDRFIS